MIGYKFYSRKKKKNNRILTDVGFLHTHQNIVSVSEQYINVAHFKCFQADDMTGWRDDVILSGAPSYSSEWLRWA